ncbi:MAG: dephospho-CoA kinase [Pelagibacteraceae bacterium]|nr:dephospho-CoA kinase [Pelagibacteraceae bacterium]
MIKICVVGSIGSGKTYISKLLAGKKFPIFNADEEVSNVYKQKSIFAKLKKTLSKYIASYPIDKQELIQAISSNQNNLKKIIKIVHPEVRKKMKLFLQKNKSKKVVIMDIPLLLENKLHKPEDVIICIDANQKLLDAKLKQRPSYNKKMISILRKIQLPIEEKKLLADFVLVNNYNKKTMQLRVKELLGRIVIND